MYHLARLYSISTVVMTDNCSAEPRVYLRIPFTCVTVNLD